MRSSISLLLLALTVRAGQAQPSQRVEFLQRASTSGARGGNLVVSINSDPRTFNRLLAFDLSTAMVDDCISADLVHLNRLTFEVEPSLASSWDVSEDGRTYTLHLRRGLRFSDGSPLSVDDVLFSLQAALEPKIGSPFADLFSSGGSLPKVTKVDEFSIRLSFAQPLGLGLRVLDSLCIVPRQRLLKPFQEGRFSSAWGASAAPTEVVGMGPFRLKEYHPGSRLVLERNPHYWKKDKPGQTLPYLDTLTFLIVPDRNAEALRFQSGEIDLLNNVEPENYAAFRREGNRGQYRIQDLGPGLEMDFLWFNLNPKKDKTGKPYLDPAKRAIFDKAEFRRAVSHALDRPGMIRSILLGLGAPQYGPISPGNKAWYSSDVSRTDYEPVRAKQMLSTIGLKDTNGDGLLELGSKLPLEITLLTVRGHMRREKMAQIIKENLSKIGIRMQVQLVDGRDLVHRITNSFEYESILFGFSPTDLEPDILTDLWLSKGSNHFWYPGQAVPATPWENEIDMLISRLVKTLDPLSRKNTFRKIEAIWAREMPAIPTITRNILVAWKSKVGNIHPSILDPHLLWNVEEITVNQRR